MTPRAPPVTGTVVDAASHAPIPGARIRALHAEFPGFNTIDVTYSDATGAFELSRLAPGRYILRAETGNRQGDSDRVIGLGLGHTTHRPDR